MNIFRIENKYKIELNKLDELYKFLNDNKAEVLFPKRFIKNLFTLIIIHTLHTLIL